MVMEEAGGNVLMAVGGKQAEIQGSKGEGGGGATGGGQGEGRQAVRSPYRR